MRRTKLVIALVLTAVVFVTVPSVASANKIQIWQQSTGDSCDLHADTPWYSGTTANAHVYMDNCSGWNLPLNGQSCMQYNAGGGWANVYCENVGAFNGSGWSLNLNTTAPCGYWFRSWAWGSVNGTTGSLTSNASYRC